MGSRRSIRRAGRYLARPHNSIPRTASFHLVYAGALLPKARDVLERLLAGGRL